jgi:hypothetical protein
MLTIIAQLLGLVAAMRIPIAFNQAGGGPRTQFRFASAKLS